jgi:hypothetical protein
MAGCIVSAQVHSDDFLSKLSFWKFVILLSLSVNKNLKADKISEVEYFKIQDHFFV